jgi:hypothetical protein
MSIRSNEGVDMSYLLRVVLPDRPGMLGAVATALGGAGADIVSLDVVERGPDGAVDDLLVTLPPGGLADTLITSAQSVPGVVVESLRPYSGGADLHRDLELVEQLAAYPAAGLALLVAGLPGVFRAGWAVLVETGPLTPGPAVLEASPGSPDLSAVALPWLPLLAGRRLDLREPWVPEHWRALGTQLLAAPVGAERAVLLGRPGGPSYRDSELLRLNHLAGIAATVAAANALA